MSTQFQTTASLSSVSTELLHCYLHSCVLEFSLRRQAKCRNVGVHRKAFAPVRYENVKPPWTDSAAATARENGPQGWRSRPRERLWCEVWRGECGGKKTWPSEAALMTTPRAPRLEVRHRVGMRVGRRLGEWEIADDPVAATRSELVAEYKASALFKLGIIFLVN
jgi:hypothetical protein